MVRTAVVLAALLLLAACAGERSPAAPDVLGEWELVSGSADDVPLPGPAGLRATLLLQDGELGGVSFCNRYSGSYRLDGGALSIEGLGGTEMGCAPDVLAAESAYLAALAAAHRAERRGADLVLTGAGTALRFQRPVPVPDSPLVGTRWTLDTLVSGPGPDGATSSALGGARLHLAADGTASGGTGCRGWTAGWHAVDDVLTVQDVVGQEVSCPPELTAQDALVLAVLTGSPTRELAGDRLTLTLPDGRGLSYRAG